MTPDIFISYASSDAEFVTQLQQDLISRGLSVWVDQDNDNDALTHRLEILKTIAACSVFIMVLSPGAIVSTKTGYELEQAQDTYTKSVVAVTWQPPADIPWTLQSRLSRVEYRLDFSGEASQDNFNRLAELLQQITGSSIKISGPATAQNSSPRRKLHRPGSRTEQSQLSIDPLALGQLVISNIVTPLDLTGDTQDWINRELEWLFSAVDHFLKTRQELMDPDIPVDVPIPAEAQQHSQANNQLLLKLVEEEVKNWRQGTLEENVEFKLNEWQNKIQGMLKDVQFKLKQLNTLLQREAQRGETGRFDSQLQAQIREHRLAIVKSLQEIAQIIDNAYGIRVTAPDQLLVYLQQAEGMQNAVALGNIIISSMIPVLDLDAADREWVNGELAWLFNAVENFLKIRWNEIEANTPVPVPIPAEAQQHPQANNQLLLELVEEEVKNWRQGTLEENVEFKLAERQNKIQTTLKNIQTGLQQLNMFLQQETDLGEDGKVNIALQDSIKGQQTLIAKYLQQLAEMINQTYGVMVTSPGQLVELLTEA